MSLPLIRCMFFFTLLMAAPAAGRPDPFILGADISWIDQRESSGIRYADRGVQKDLFVILKEHKFNWIRLRLFVDPTATVPGCSESPYSTQGFCDLTHTLKMARRTKAAGFKFLLDFHYSDVWADPGKQFKPVSWEGLGFDSLKATVCSYTEETLRAFEAQGTLPDMVQVGNEIYAGMLWPDGKSDAVVKLAALINAGIDGVEAVSPAIRIMLHSIAKDSPNEWLAWIEKAGVSRVDVFGLSYYSEFHGTIADLTTRLNDVVRNHPVDVVVAEYAGNHRAVNDAVFNLPGEKGIGTFCWEPQEWGEVLLDWVNNRRETNAKIDLYPVMSKDYGNDDFVRVMSTSGQSPWCIARPARPEYFVPLRLFTVAHTAISLQGRHLGSGVCAPGGYCVIRRGDGRVR